MKVTPHPGSLTVCANTVHRLYPIIPFNVRTALVDTSLPRGGGPLGLDVRFSNMIILISSLLWYPKELLATSHLSLCNIAMTFLGQP